MTREEAVALVVAQRDRNFNKPGSEYDGSLTPNDWVAISTHYCTEQVVHKGMIPSAEDYLDGLVKAAAVLLEAIEKVPAMKAKGLLVD
jgi:hypothetical protein